MKLVPLFCFLTVILAWGNETFEIQAARYTRKLELQSDTWVTTELVDCLRQQKLPITSDEFGVRLQDGTLLTAKDYQSSLPSAQSPGTHIRYTRRNTQTYPKDAPLEIIAHFTNCPWAKASTDTYLQKSLTLIFDRPVQLASLEVERFTSKANEERGGRGEAVVLNQQWIWLPENPTMLTRHTDGNQPSAYSHHFEKVGNHSYVNFENGDLETHPTSGLVRCFHFPPIAQSVGSQWIINSQKVDLLLTPTSYTPEAYVIDTVRPEPRTFTHYNNWFDSSGKDIRDDKLPATHRAFLDALGSSKIKIDAMVPDNGWQNRQSVWQPSSTLFPNGMADLAKLGNTLRQQGSSLGLWVALDGTTNDIAWGVKNGYTKAQANAYFSHYFAHYSLADSHYNEELTQQLHHLVDEARVSYFKFDFNHLSNIVPTDRQGHEAEMNGLIQATRYAHDQGVFINATNWTWHSPAWLHYANSVWLLAGDDGFNANWPELSGRAQATTDRDVFFWRMWGQAGDRPWFPISSIMTHGIIRNRGGQMSFKTDTLRDWSDHVLMHYGRGTLLREWYLTPSAMLPEEWKALIAIHEWTDSRRSSLNHTCFIGGRPDEGEVYGYIGWARDGSTGTLVARNPSPQAQKLIIPVNETTQFLGKEQSAWIGHQVYPQNQNLPLKLNAQHSLEIEVPGYETVALEMNPGTVQENTVRQETHAVAIKNQSAQSVSFSFEPKIGQRHELVVIGYPDLPTIKINGLTLKETRQTKSKINQFPSYARDGMPSKKARAWSIAGYDLSTFSNTEFKMELSGTENSTRAEAWLITDNTLPKEETSNSPSPLTFASVRRQTACLFPEATIAPVVIPKIPLSPADLSQIQSAEINLEVFGINAGYGDKTLFLNHHSIATLPTGGDQWKPVHLSLNAAQISQLQLHNEIEIQAPANEDKFKVGKVSIKVTLKDGRMTQIKTSDIFTSHTDWSYFEGKVFQLDSTQKTRISPVLLIDF
jgi:hypothetical protein